jgi:hypothetical protein
MSAKEKAKEAIAQIDQAMTLLNGHQFDGAWYLLSMAKLSLLEVANPIDGQHLDYPTRLISSTDSDYAAILPKKH